MVRSHRMPATKGAFLITLPSGPRGRTTGNGCDLVNPYRNRVTNGIIAIIVAYNAAVSCYVDAVSMKRCMYVN